MTAGLPLMKTVLTPLAKSILIPLVLAAAVSVTYAAIQKKIYESGTTALIISNDEMKHIMKTVKLFEESGLLIKAISEKLKNEAKEQKGRFLPVLLRTLAASTLGNAVKGQGKMSMWACKGVVRSKFKILVKIFHELKDFFTIKNSETFMSKKIYLL